MTSRAAIFKRITSAGQAADTTSPHDPLSTGDPLRPAHSPQPTHSGSGDLADRFVHKLESNGVSAHVCGAAAAIPASLTALTELTASNPQPVCVAPHPTFKGLDWDVAGVPKVHVGGWTPDAKIALSHGRLGIADSGSIVLASGVDSPTGLAFLPEVHVIALHRRAVVASLTDAMTRFGNWTTPNRSALPRAINIISGASRTADIAGKLVQGAHGPSKLCVIIYDDA